MGWFALRLQFIVCPFRHNLLSNRRLCAHRINRDDAPTDVEQFEQGWNRRYLIAFILDLHLPQQESMLALPKHSLDAELIAFYCAHRSL